MPSDTISGLLKQNYSVAVGQQIGSYRIERLLEEGGMGAVFEAMHPEIGRRAAVKILRRSFARDPEFATRFLNEARAANLVGHPNIVEIFEFGRLPDETPYIIMEFLSGQSLASRLQKQPLPSLSESLEWCRQLAHAMTAAHEKGIIHRDLKPENVFLVPDPVHEGGVRVKILDFGIAKLRPDQSVSGASVTRAGSTMGSPAYMAPEQCYELGQVTERADVYALGIILYELISGRLPFRAEMPAEVLVMQAKATPPPLSQLAPTVPANVEALVHRLLQKKAESRPSMAEVLATLSQLQSEVARGRGQPSAARPTAGLPSNGTRALVLVTVVSLLAAGLLLRLMLRAPNGSPRSTPTAPLAKPNTPEPSSLGSVAAPTQKQPATVQCEISSDPSGVQIVDAETDKLLGTTPTKLLLDRSTQPQKVVLRKPGYQERLVPLDRTRDVVRSESLLPLPRKTRPTGSPGTSTAPATPNNQPTTSPKTKPGKDELLAPAL